MRPHPHIGLATVTYLFEGEIVHRDSLGVGAARSGPGDVNWMTAGRGIVALRAHAARGCARPGAPLHGIQTWVALPREHEEVEPAFVHHPRATLPVVAGAGATVRA